MAGYIGSKASVVSSGAERKKVFNITTSTTALTGLSYTANQVHVFHNGVRLISGTDYTETNDTTITLTNAAENGDQVVVVSYASFQTSDTVSASAGGTFSGAVDVNADGATVLTVDRATSDGTIIDVQKDGSTVGSIGAEGGKLYIDSSGGVEGKLKNQGSVSYLWHSDYFTSINDNSTDLGMSDLRFKDLYLSGGVYLGGTGSANKLDDYEEGTWTPTALQGLDSVGVISSGATYTKIGRLVHLQLAAILDGDGTSDQIQIGGLPFASANNSVGRGNAVPWIDFCNVGTSRIPLAAIWDGNSLIRLFATRTDSIANQGNLQGNHISTNNQTEFQLNIQYYAA